MSEKLENSETSALTELQKVHTRLKSLIQKRTEAHAEVVSSYAHRTGMLGVVRGLSREVEVAASELATLARKAGKLDPRVWEDLIEARKVCKDLKPYPEKSSSGLPLGVSAYRGGYRVVMRVGAGKPEHLGLFKTLEEAREVAEEAYYLRQQKVELADDL